ncbi:hypothetical protein M426DRAFT_15046 [Hypoxylon sp. CI-4A]|nr:hypothetical protein M426DRAFT_15046 [Hypoxylon sp. CI-4A]
MDPRNQIPALDLGSDAFYGATNNTLPVDETWTNQQNTTGAMQAMLPAADSPITQVIGGSRADSLKRHANIHSNEIPQYPCEYCERRQGKKGFHRPDHLIQHLKTYHKIDTEEKLPKLQRGRAATAIATAASTVSSSIAGGSGGFALQARAPLFSCTIVGCSMGGANGFRQQDQLREHQAFAHPFQTDRYGNMLLDGGMQSYQQSDASQFQFQQF